MSWGAKLLAQAEAIGIDVTHFAQRAGFDQLAQAHDGRVILQYMADHQNTSLTIRQADQLCPLLVGQRQGFLAQDVLAGQKGLAGQGIMGFCRGSYDDRSDRRCPHLGGVGDGGAVGGQFGRRLARRLVRVAHQVQDTQLGEIAHQVSTPIAAANDGQPDWFRTCCRILVSINQAVFS